MTFCMRISSAVVLSLLAVGGQRLVAETSVLEEIETKDGKRFSGRVVGYDIDSRSYILRTRGGDLKIPEATILTVHAVSESNRQKDGGPESDAVTRPSVPLPEVSKKSTRPSEVETRDPRADASTVETRVNHVDLVDLLRGATSPDPNGFSQESRLALELARNALSGGDVAAARRHLSTVEKSIADSVEARLLRGAVWIAEHRFDEAYRHLRRVTLSLPRNGAALALFAMAAQGRGYFARARLVMEKSIELRFDGADAAYRRFAWLRDNEPDPIKIYKAWQAYVDSDADFSVVVSPEGQAFQSAKAALEAGDHGRALQGFRLALRHNPRIRTQVVPLHVRMIEERARALEARGDHEGVMHEFSALELEQPEKAERFAIIRRQAEVRWIESRLNGVQDPTHFERAVTELVGTVPDLRETHATLLRTRLEALGVSMAGAGKIDETIQVLEILAARGSEPPVSDAVGGAIRGRIEEERAGGRVAQVDAWMTALRASGHSDAAKPVGPASVARPASNAVGNLVSPVPPVPEDVAVARVADIEVGPLVASVSGPAIASLEYLSLIAGNEWVYRHRDGTRDVQRLERVEERGALLLIYRFKSRFELDDLVIPYEKTCFVDGEFVYQGTDQDPVRADRVLPLPIRAGSVWAWQNGEIEFEKRCESTDQTVHCLAGTFHDCLKVEMTTRYGGMDGHSVAQTMYYAPYVGLVKVESANPTDSYELEAFTLGGHGRAEPSAAPMPRKSAIVGPDIPVEILPVEGIDDGLGEGFENE